ncbi:hypothetical protein INT44_008389 [Umbelopsis vinacea]|uniref:Uncharacterized protein n=1 Tax=Umbelopsis vinacea TaxID=44442 RepID=A0A8H7PVV6_9FUNG|nr:hypothetical protein INT44_008389 [Umbelopsis vinacea]
MNGQNVSKPLLQTSQSSENIKSYHTMLFHKAYDEKKEQQEQSIGFTSRSDTPRPTPKRTTSTGAFIIEENNPSKGDLEMSNGQNQRNPSHAISDRFLHLGNKD